MTLQYLQELETAYLEEFYQEGTQKVSKLKLKRSSQSFSSPITLTKKSITILNDINQLETELEDIFEKFDYENITGYLQKQQGKFLLPQQSSFPSCQGILRFTIISADKLVTKKWNNEVYVSLKKGGEDFEIARTTILTSTNPIFNQSFVVPILDFLTAVDVFCMNNVLFYLFNFFSFFLFEKH